MASSTWWWVCIRAATSPIAWPARDRWTPPRRPTVHAGGLGRGAPRAARARSLVPDLPPVIDDAIARLLAKDPLDRFPSAEALAWALDEHTSDGGKALASRQPAPVPARGHPCPRCGGWLVQTAAVCADCG